MRCDVVVGRNNFKFQVPESGRKSLREGWYGTFVSTVTAQASGT